MYIKTKSPASHPIFYQWGKKTRRKSEAFFLKAFGTKMQDSEEERRRPKKIEGQASKGWSLDE